MFRRFHFSSAGLESANAAHERYSSPITLNQLLFYPTLHQRVYEREKMFGGIIIIIIIIIIITIIIIIIIIIRKDGCHYV